MSRPGDMRLAPGVYCNPAVQGGAPCCDGTRVPTAALWSFHEAGYSFSGIWKEYPTLTGDAVMAALDWESSVRKGGLTVANLRAAGQTLRNMVETLVDEGAPGCATYRAAVEAWDTATAQGDRERDVTAAERHLAPGQQPPE